MKNYSMGLLLFVGISSVGLAQQTDLKNVIADGRLPLVSTDQSVWLTHPAILQAASQARQYWHQHNSAYEENFRVMDSSEGTFTRPEGNQTAVLYLLSIWPRCCSNMGLAIIENDQLVRNIAFAGGTHHLFSVNDLNDDELDELALIGSFGMGGSNETSLSLVSLSADSTTLLGRLPLVQDNCGTMLEDSGRNSFRITYDENSPGEFHLEHYFNRCDDDVTAETASSVSSIQLETIANNDDYIDLPIN